MCHVQIILSFVFIRAGRRARVYLRSASGGSVEGFSVSGSGGSLSLWAGVQHVGAGGEDRLALETPVSRPLGSRWVDCVNKLSFDLKTLKLFVFRWLLLRPSGRSGPGAGWGLGEEPPGWRTGLSGVGRGRRRWWIRWGPASIPYTSHDPLGRRSAVCLSAVCLEEASEGCPAISAVQREKKLLDGMIQNLLPTVGPSVRSLSLAYSSAVSSKMVRMSWYRQKPVKLVPHSLFVL